ncbi:hypothetical protein Hanom_Chr03g00266301 [Helianthus anomalus]
MVIPNIPIKRYSRNVVQKASQLNVYGAKSAKMYRNKILPATLMSRDLHLRP